MMFRYLDRAAAWIAFALLVCGQLASHGLAEDAAPILDVTIEVDFGEDLGQNFGALFEAYDDQGNVVAGAGFLGAYNTQPRSDRGRLHFFVKPKQMAFTVDKLPRVNRQTGVYLSSSGQALYARARNGRDTSFYIYDEQSGTWQIDNTVTRYDTQVAGRSLQVSPREVTYAGKTVLAAGDDSPGTRLLENYYAAGQLVLRVQEASESNDSNRLVACRWSPYSDQSVIDPHQGVVITLRSHGEFVYAFGQLDGDLIARRSNLDRPYLGAYLNYSQLFAAHKTQPITRYSRR